MLSEVGKILCSKCVPPSMPYLDQISAGGKIYVGIIANRVHRMTEGLIEDE